MPRRPREHIIEDLARAALREVFAREGWTTEDLDEDYGEDLLVRIFEHGQATLWSFFIQSKSTDAIQRLLTKEQDALTFPIRRDHAEHWERFWEPVVLAIYDTKSKNTYWEVVQSFMAKRTRRPNAFTRTINVRVPIDNRLDEEGLRRLRNRTKRRLGRFEQQQESARQLVAFLNESWGVKIDYSPESSVITLPKGKFVPDEDAGMHVLMFGRVAAHMRELTERTGLAPEQLSVKSIKLVKKMLDEFKEGNIIQLWNPDGSVATEWKTFEELTRHVERRQELEDD